MSVCLVAVINQYGGERRGRKIYGKNFLQTLEYFPDRMMGKVLFLNYLVTNLGRGTKWESVCNKIIV